MSRLGISNRIAETLLSVQRDGTTATVSRGLALDDRQHISAVLASENIFQQATAGIIPENAPGYAVPYQATSGVLLGSLDTLNAYNLPTYQKHDLVSKIAEKLAYSATY